MDNDILNKVPEDLEYWGRYKYYDFKTIYDYIRAGHYSRHIYGDSIEFQGIFYHIKYAYYIIKYLENKYS